MNKYLKLTRLVFALFFFALSLIVFIDFRELLPIAWINFFTFMQFSPSLVKFINTISIVSVGFITILIITALVGRVYCSTLCPLGLFQDTILRIKQWISPSRLKKQKNYPWLKYSFLALFLFSIFSGFIGFVLLLDPYSIFGRMANDLFKPIIISLNNLLYPLFKFFEIYSIYPIDIHWFALIDYTIPILSFLLIIVFTIFFGRLYCNTICPIGTILGLISKFGILKLTINESSCHSCGKCSNVCKSGCLDIKNKTINTENCINCYNCINTCDSNAIVYKLNKKYNKSYSTKESSNRRQFISNTGIIALTIPLIYQNRDTKKQIVPTPSGSISIENYNANCTACHLCIANCPTGVLRPSLNEFGIENMMQPYLDFRYAACDYECTRCTEVCPTGAIHPQSIEEKQTTQIGIVRFIEHRCVVVKENTACGACAEVCPTQAVTMIDYVNGHTSPVTNTKIYVACTACEYACPISARKAIFVIPYSKHSIALKPQQENINHQSQDEFPF